MTPSDVRRMLWGLTIFAAGLVLLLQAIGTLPGEAWKFIWPTFILIIGLELIFMSIYKYGEEEIIELPKIFLRKKKKKAKK